MSKSTSSCEIEKANYRNTIAEHETSTILVRAYDSCTVLVCKLTVRVCVKWKQYERRTYSRHTVYEYITQVSV